MAKNLCVWFEIPVTDMDRARKFYSAVMGLELSDGVPMGDSVMSFFPMTDEWDNSGGLTKSPSRTPSSDGCYVYLNGGEDLAEPLARVEPAGGRIVVPKTQISPENGFFAMFTDTEGNMIGFWSAK